MNREEKLRQILESLPAQDRPHWIAEANRLANLGERYHRIKPKRRINPATKKREFVTDVVALWLNLQKGT